MSRGRLWRVESWVVPIHLLSVRTGPTSDHRQCLSSLGSILPTKSPNQMAASTHLLAWTTTKDTWSNKGMPKKWTESFNPFQCSGWHQSERIHLFSHSFAHLRCKFSNIRYSRRVHSQHFSMKSQWNACASHIWFISGFIKWVANKSFEVITNPWHLVPMKRGILYVSLVFWYAWWHSNKKPQYLTALVQGSQMWGMHQVEWARMTALCHDWHYCRFFGGLARVAWLSHRLRKPRRGRKSGKLDDPRRSNRSLQRSWQRRRQPARRVKQPDDHIGSKYATSWLTAVWNEQLSGKFKWRTKPYRTDLRIGCSKLADFHSFKMNTESILNPTW